MIERYEVLEHTADVGLRAGAGTPEEVFEAVGEGLVTLEGAWFPDGGTERPVHIEASDREALLVAWLDELLYILETEEAVVGAVAVDRVRETSLDARLRLAPRGDRDIEGVGVKAATYHRLRLDREPDGRWVGQVYLDV